MTRITAWSRPTNPEFDHDAWTRRNSDLTPQVQLGDTLIRAGEGVVLSLGL